MCKCRRRRLIMYRRRKGGVKKIVRKWGVLMSAMLKQKLIDIANGFTKYGLWKGGGSSNLSELDDVALTNLQTNDVLTYNGSVWVNDDNLQKQIDTLNSNLNSVLHPSSIILLGSLKAGQNINIDLTQYTYVLLMGVEVKIIPVAILTVITYFSVDMSRVASSSYFSHQFVIVTHSKITYNSEYRSGWGDNLNNIDIYGVK